MTHEVNTAEIVSRSWRDLRNVAWASIAINLIAGASLYFILSHGLQTNPNVLARIEYIAHNSTLWIGSWFTWNLASLSILVFFFYLNRAQQIENNSLLKLALILTITAVALDLSADAIEMIFIPSMATQIASTKFIESSSFVELFLNFDRLAVGFTGYFANGLYTISTVLACWSIRNNFPKIVSLCGFPIALCGFAVSYFALTNDTAGLFWSNALLVPFLLIWQIGIAIVADQKAHKQ